MCVPLKANQKDTRRETREGRGESQLTNVQYEKAGDATLQQRVSQEPLPGQLREGKEWQGIRC